ncbi:hypothetical protein [Actinomyces oricola]
MTAPALLGPLDADPRARGRTASMTLLVMRVTLQENVRRRGALALALLLPLVFFLARIDAHWTALRLLAIGLGWAAATLSLFTTVSSRRVDRRLAVSGARPTALVVGRYAAVLLLGWLIAAVYAAIVALSIGDRLVHPAFVLPMLLLTVAVSVPLGSLAAALVPRDLEGALLLLAVIAAPGGHGPATARGPGRRVDPSTAPVVDPRTRELRRREPRRRGGRLHAARTRARGRLHLRAHGGRMVGRTATAAADPAARTAPRRVT